MAQTPPQLDGLSPELQEPFFHLGFTVTVARSVAEAYLLGHRGARRRLEDCLGRMAVALDQLEAADAPPGYDGMAETVHNIDEGFQGLLNTELEGARQFYNDAMDSIELELEKAKMEGATYDDAKDRLDAWRQFISPWTPCAELERLMDDVAGKLEEAPAEYAPTQEIASELARFYLAGGFGVDEDSISPASPEVNVLCHLIRSVSPSLENDVRLLAEQWKELSQRAGSDKFWRIYSLFLRALHTCVEVNERDESAYYFGQLVKLTGRQFIVLDILCIANGEAVKLEDHRDRIHSTEQFGQELSRIRGAFRDAADRLPTQPQKEAATALINGIFPPRRSGVGHFLGRPDLVKLNESSPQ